MNIVCIIQARTTSSRLPNKVLLKLPYNGEKTVLEQVINRVRKSEYINKIVVATTINVTDDPIEKLCSEIKIQCYRGSEENVLSRYYEAGKKYNADMVVRVTSDCPCIDPQVIDLIIEKHIKEKNDYTSNNQERTYPHGLDCEIFNFNILEEAYLKARDKYETEHVTPYIYKSNPEKFKIGILKDDDDNHNIRITLDTEEDYTLLCAVYDFIYEDKKYFNKNDIIELFKNKKWLYNINKNIIQKKVCSNLTEELQEAVIFLKKQDLFRAAKFIEEEK